MISSKRELQLNSFILALSENHSEQGHPDVEPVLRLSEVGGPRVGVELWRDLKDPGNGIRRMNQLIQNHDSSQLKDLT